MIWVVVIWLGIALMLDLVLPVEDRTVTPWHDAVCSMCLILCWPVILVCGWLMSLAGRVPR